MTRKGWIVLTVVAVLGLMFTACAGLGVWLLVKHAHKSIGHLDSTTDTTRSAPAVPVVPGWKADSILDTKTGELTKWLSAEDSRGQYSITIFSSGSMIFNVEDSTAPNFVCSESEGCFVIVSFDNSQPIQCPVISLLSPPARSALQVADSTFLHPLTTSDVLTVTFYTTSGLRTVSIDIKDCPIVVPQM